MTSLKHFGIEKLVVFDLDETLVHCIFNDKDEIDADVYLDIKMPNGKIANTGFNIRPYWVELMEEIQDDWEIVVFTASCKNYADAILDHLDPENKYFHHRYYRETCWKTEDGVYVKDLRVFHQWDLKDIVLVDNAVYSFGYQLENGIPIISYYKGKDDEQLLHLKEYLLLIANKNLKKDLRKTFMMSELVHYDLDEIAERYFQEDDEEEDDFDILDQMFKHKKYLIPKGKSFKETRTSSNKWISIEGVSHNSAAKHSEETKFIYPNFKPEEPQRSYSTVLDNTKVSFILSLN